MPTQNKLAAAGLHLRVIADYFNTTSGTRQNISLDYSKCTKGLKRGLGRWFDVKGLDVLDLGSGTGELCWLARDQGASSVTGVNLSQGEIDYAQDHVDARFVCEDILHFLSAAPSDSIDRIFALNILEHLSKDQLVQVLEEAKRLLRPGGNLVAMVPNALSPFGTMTRYWDITHQLSFTPSSIVQLMRLCEFSNVEFREWGPRPHGAVSAVRFFFWQGIRTLIIFWLLVENGSVKYPIFTSDMLFRLFK